MFGLGTSIFSRSMRGARSLNALGVHSVGGKFPAVIADFVAGHYAMAGQPVAFDDLFTFSRLSGAWKVNALGRLEYVEAGEPRSGHHVWKNGVLTPAGIALNSSARTSLSPYSEDLTGAGWSKVFSTIDADSATAPDGALSADKVVPDDAATNGNAGFFLDLTAGTYAIPFFANAAGFDEIAFVSNMTGSYVGCQFDMSTGVATSAAGWSAEMEEWGGGWFLCWATGTAGSDGTYDFRITNNTTGQVGDGVSGFYAWGARLEAGALPADYIKTEGAQVTVAAETLQIDDAKISAALGGTMPSALTIAVEGFMTYEDVDTFNTIGLVNWFGDASNRIQITLDTNGTDTGEVRYKNIVGGVSTVSGSATDAYSPGRNVPFSVAMRTKAGVGGLRGASDGDLSNVLSPDEIPDLIAATLLIGDIGNVSITRVRVWTDELTDAELQEVTS